MNPQQLSQIKDLLLQEKQDLESRLKQNHNYGMERGMNDSVGELSGYDNHPADLGTELYERGKDLALHDADVHHLRDIDEALKRIEEGTYGKCKVCGKEIPYERLEAVPWTEFCKEHHPDPHSSMRRPVEEKALGHYAHSFRDDEEFVAYDGEDAWQEVERYGTSNPPDYFREGESYNELVIDHDEQRGYVDLTEGFAITDMDGRHEERYSDITHSDAYRLKESEEAQENALENE